MPSSETPQPFDPKTQELVILVHGTFANNPSKSHDDHLKWWQAGGEVWTKIDEKLPEQFHVASDKKKEVFSWSGDNSERDRRAGGRELFKHLQKLEKTGARYHLIGHSHGGSVIWHCLLESVKQRFRRRRNVSDDKLSLPGLQSYTTIGTPFLQLRSLGLVSRFSPWFWMGVLIASMIATLALMSDLQTTEEFLMNTVRMIPGEARILGESIEENDGEENDGEENDGEVFSNGNAGRNIITPPPNLPVVNLGGEFLRTVLVLASVFAAFLSMVMWAWASAVQLEASVVRQGARIRNQAFVEFGARWLGIWSRHDEAINGLRASLKLGGNIAPRIEVSGVTVFDFDRRMRFYRFFARWFVAPAFNLMVSWPSDRIIWKSVSRGMQGNDRPGCLVSDVSPGPIVPRNVEWEQLPELYDNRLVEQSNKCLIDRSTTLLPQLREVLSQLAWTRPEQLSLLLSNETTFEGNELVHTSYFHEPAILDLISCHVLRHNRVKAPRSDSKSSTARWCRRFRHKARDLSRDRSLQDAALPLLGARNRRAIVALLMAAVLIAGWWFDYSLSEQLQRSLKILEGPADFVAFAVTTIAVVVAPFLAWSGFKRAKRGARSPRIARWGWRLARVEFVIYVLWLYAILSEG